MKWMNVVLVPAMMLAATAALSLTSCMVEGRATVIDEPSPTAEIIVQEAPPSPRAEIVTVAPSPSHVWVGGYWARRQHSWTWIHGAWVVRPHATAIWVPGAWQSRGVSWVWVSGHWGG